MTSKEDLCLLGTQIERRMIATKRYAQDIKAKPVDIYQATERDDIVFLDVLIHAARVAQYLTVGIVTVITS